MPGRGNRAVTALPPVTGAVVEASMTERSIKGGHATWTTDRIGRLTAPTRGGGRRSIAAGSGPDRRCCSSAWPSFWPLAAAAPIGCCEVHGIRVVWGLGLLERSSQSGAVAFAQCVRSHGVPDFPDPQNGHFLISGSDREQPELPVRRPGLPAPAGPGGSATNGGGGGSNSSAELAFAQCMQTHGVPNFPDPSSNGGTVGSAGVDPNSPQFQSAFQACSR